MLKISTLFFSKNLLLFLFYSFNIFFFFSSFCAFFLRLSTNFLMFMQLKADKRHCEEAIVIASEVHLDRGNTFVWLKALFSGFADSPPKMFVLMGDFCSNVNIGHARYKGILKRFWVFLVFLGDFYTFSPFFRFLKFLYIFYIFNVVFNKKPDLKS